MVREILITFYLVIFKVIFNIFKLSPQKKKTVGVASFGDNIFYTARSIQDKFNQEIVILKDKSCHYKFDSIGKVIAFDIKHPIQFVESIYHLATATTILVDTHYGFLAVSNFRPGTKCIQLWHAAGALKQFGMQDPTIENRSKKARDRFQTVYSRFDYTVVGSEKMADVFKDNFDLTDERILRTGVPRTDFFFNQKKTHRIYEKMKNKLPITLGKKVILYAPTYRNGNLSNYQLELDLKQLYKELSDEYVLFIKLHPAVSYSLNEEYEEFVYDVSRFKINHLLLMADILITDYSSIPFEFSLLEKPMIFFAYDLEQYRIKSGLIDDYETNLPGPIVYTTNEIIEVIQANLFDLKKIKTFANDWNTYSQGNSSYKLASFITGTEEKQREEILV